MAVSIRAAMLYNLAIDVRRPILVRFDRRRAGLKP